MQNTGLATSNGGASLGLLPCKFDATAAPAVGNDNTEGYAAGSLWLDVTAGNLYVCTSVATGAAVWIWQSPTACRLEHLTWAGALVPVGATADIRDTVTDNGATQVITTGITQPTTGRNVVCTAGGTAGDIKAVSHTITGSYLGVAVVEVLPAFTVNTTGDVVGVKIFDHITSISQPAHDGTGATFTYKQGAKLGLQGRKLARNTVLKAYLGEALEGTAPTVSVDASVAALNMATLNSTLNGTAVDIYLMTP